jgi:hypothetical protein
MSTRRIAVGIAAMSLVVCTAANADTIYDWTWSSDGISASGSFDVLNGYIQSATGTIAGGGLGTVGSLSLLTATSPGVVSNPDPANSTPGSFVYQNGNGDDIEGDTAFSSSSPWVDLYGPVMAISGTGLGIGNHGQSNYTFNLWYQSGFWYENLGGNGGIPGQVDANGGTGTLTVSPVPLPAGLPLLLCGLGGLVVLATRRRRPRLTRAVPAARTLLLVPRRQCRLVDLGHPMLHCCVEALPVGR